MNSALFVVVLITGLALVGAALLIAGAYFASLVQPTER